MEAPHHCGWQQGWQVRRRTLGERRQPVDCGASLFCAIERAAIHAAEATRAEYFDEGGGAMGQSRDAVGLRVLAAAFFMQNRAFAKMAVEMAIVQEGQEPGQSKANE